MRSNAPRLSRSRQRLSPDGDSNFFGARRDPIFVIGNLGNLSRNQRDSFPNRLRLRPVRPISVADPCEALREGERLSIAILRPVISSRRIIMKLGRVDEFDQAKAGGEADD